MSKGTIVIYKSKTGFTARYAQWISEALGCGRLAYKDRNKVSLSDYDTVIFGSSLRAGIIGGLGWLKKRLPELSGKKVAVFVTGAGEAGAQQDAVLRKNLSGGEWAQVKAFYMQSGLSYEHMGALDRTMMSTFKKMMKKKEGEDSEVYKMIANSFDCCDREKIEPLIQFCGGEK